MPHAAPAIRPRRALRLALAGAVAAAAALGMSGCAASGPEPRAIPLTELEQGMCFDQTADRTMGLVKPDCGWPHDYEVASIIELDGAAFPGDEAIAAQADAECTSAFAAFTGRVPTAAPELLARYLGPSAQSWAAGDRALACLVASADGQPRTASAAAPK